MIIIIFNRTILEYLISFSLIWHSVVRYFWIMTVVVTVMWGSTNIGTLGKNEQN